MTDLFGFQFNLPEFLLGLGVAVVVLFLLYRIAPAFLWVLRQAAFRVKLLLEQFRAGATERYQRELIGRAETMHLARAIFALDEIVVEPRPLVLPSPPAPQHDEGGPEHNLRRL